MIIGHLLAAGLTACLVLSGFDWQYFSATRHSALLSWAFTAAPIGGLIPLMAENNPLYSPLALVIIGGLLSSTILTRVVTPVLYKLLAPRITPDAAPSTDGTAQAMPVPA